MITITISRYSKVIACFFLLLLYGETVLAGRLLNKTNRFYYGRTSPGKAKIQSFFDDKRSAKENISINKEVAAVETIEFSAAKKSKPFIGGPTQPEMQSFQSANASNMVDLFSGDFSYNIPLMDVGGYPINISYRSGITMDQEASWVGLGWNINPGTITRNMRGLPDDFNGKNDSIKKITSIRENKTIGVNLGTDFELTGVPLNLQASTGIFYNNYKGWGLENSVNASINAGIGSKGSLTGGLSLSNNTQEGLTLSPSLEVKLNELEGQSKSGITSSFSTSLPYNSRTGLKGLQLSAGIKQYQADTKNQKANGTYETYSTRGSISSVISFSSPTYTPSITIPFTSNQFSFTAKVGGLKKVAHPNFFVSGYVSKQRIAPGDTMLSLPSYGYLHYQDGAKNRSSLLDFNREKEIPYREKPAVPHIALPMYTYDAFSITGEGTGGMFRAYRGDVGFINDHFMRTKDESGRVSLDLGFGDLTHHGVDLNVNRAFTQSGPWVNQNPLASTINFKENSGNYEAVYFRNPGEKSINSKAFFEAMGGDDVVAASLYQAGISSPVIQSTNYLTRYRNKRVVGRSLLTPQNAIKQERDKRTQVISYLSAKEADLAGLSKYIESYPVNQFDLNNCSNADLGNIEGDGNGLPVQYFNTINFKGTPTSTVDQTINHQWAKNEAPLTGFPANNFSIRWQGRIKAPETGSYIFKTISDDGVRLWLNDSLIINHWNDHASASDEATVRLIAGEVYKIKMEYYEHNGKAAIKLYWTYPGQTEQIIPKKYLYGPAADVYMDSYLTKEKRVNAYRKENHISQVDVLNSDGRRYVYGIPVYNLKQKEATFAIQNNRGNSISGLAGYTNGEDNSTNNRNGKDWYYNSEQTPAYAHSFLLSGILSTDYVDVTGNGITDDDLGDAVKFNYSKISGSNNPYRWRAPYVKDSVTLNEGLKTDSRDDKGNYVYGEKELWYLHSISSKTMVATFVVENRNDLFAIDEAGNKYDGGAKRLKEINLYSKADFFKNPATARPVKTVHFEYSYELCKGVNKPLTDSGKLTLKKIWFTYNGNDKGKKNPYVFNYNSKNPDYNIKSYDRWGNYKDPLENPGSTSTNIISNAEYPYALQDSVLAAENAAAWSLDSIYLPSGGSLKVQYESDDYAYVQNKRAMQLFKIIGLGNSPSLSSSNRLHTLSGDNLYIYVSVPGAVSSKKEVFQKYLADAGKLMFRLFVKMPSDQYGSGNEYVSCYADIDGDNYGLINSNIVWIKISGISMKGDGAGNYSPLAKAAIQFLRLNLPSKAYPNSEPGEDIDLGTAVRIISTLGTNLVEPLQSFDRKARNLSWASQIDTSRSFVRLNSPEYKKSGGGHRVKRIVIYDNWNKMTGQRAANYGQQYSYTTQKQINGTNKTISSGVASYEPGIGGEENPFRQPIEYVEKISALGPVTLGYSEEPLGESLFPSASIGYSKVRVRTINYKNVKSANGFEESCFYTSYDFPTLTDRSLLDGDTKKRYKPALANLLRINARHYVTLSQGFKVELNDMNGKLRSQASYSEVDPNNYISYTENIYRVEDRNAEHKRLANTVSVIHPDGTVDTTALIGKEVELMMDMREQLSITNGNNINLNADLFSIPFVPPVFLIPSFINLAQREENQFRSVATLKVLQRYGILDSVIHIDKGSKVSTKDLLYDSETGDVVLTRTQNEFNDPIYNFSYPSHWAYDGMGLAYKNINATFSHVSIKDGKLTAGLPLTDSVFFSSGDEILVAGKQQTGLEEACVTPFSTFHSYTKIWAIDSSVIHGGSKAIYFIDKNGKPYNGFDIDLKVVRSGRRNILGSVGSVTTLANPLQKTNGAYSMVLNTTSKVVNTSAGEFKQFWKVNDVVQPYTDTSLIGSLCPTGYTYSAQLQACVKDTIAQIDSSFSICLMESQNSAYSSCGTVIYSSFNLHNTSFTRSRFDITDTFWINSDYRLQHCNYDPATTLEDENESESLMSSNMQSFMLQSGDSTQSLNEFSVSSQMSMNSLQSSVMGGPLNRAGVWACPNTTVPSNTWFGFTIPIQIPHNGIYYIGMAADNLVRVTIDGQPFKEDNQVANSENFKLWHIYPKYLTSGLHNLKVEGQDDGSFATGFGCEIYDNTETELRDANSYDDLNLIFSTKDVVGQTYPSSYSCPAGYALSGDPSSGFVCRSIVPTTGDTVLSNYCKSTVVDTILNPYVTGILGNWRANKSYTYFTGRAESNPLFATNIRLNGTFNDFQPFWNFQDGRLQPNHDTTRWVWNSEMTLFNSKGLEIENKDPLGRYNAGLYGYNSTMPVAVVQNSQYRETAFEGFEDYDFQTQFCDTACQSTRQIDFTSYKSKLSSAQKHSGKSSLKINGEEEVAISFRLATLQDTEAANLEFSLKTDACTTGNTLEEIKSDSAILLPSFSPYKGKRMLLSAWVKEEQACSCTSYTNNRIRIIFNDGSSTTISFAPTGNIIEGWQRYEAVFDIAEQASTITVSMEATSTTSVYFDDLRLHPFNANMKSFVYSPTTLRLMAELDENNYAAFYEYDDDGTLIRVKKETEKGIKTISETRSALLKQ